MSETDIMRLDGQVLKTFLVILEESSVSRAADRLDLTQSAVSHTLAKLRKTLGDPLFVRSGMGLVPTETALSLKAPAQDILDRMKALTQERPFDPCKESLHFKIAANDMQRDLVFPRLMRDALRDGIDLRLEIVPSGVPSVAMLRDARCDLLLTPLPPDGPDFIQRKVFTGEMRLFYDAQQREAPKTLENYIASEHIAVQFAMGGSSAQALKSSELTERPAPRVAVSNFAGITPFVQGTTLLATEAEFMGHTSLRALDMAPLPFKAEPINVFMVWHERATNDPAHKWLRHQIIAIAAEVTGAA